MMLRPWIPTGQIVGVACCILLRTSYLATVDSTAPFDGTLWESNNERHEMRQHRTLMTTSDTQTISFNSLIESNTVKKFTCNMTYNELMSLNVPYILLNAANSNTNTTTNNNTTNNTTDGGGDDDDTPCKGPLACLWQSICNLFRFKFTLFDLRTSLSSNTPSNPERFMKSAMNNSRILFFGTEQVTSTNQNPIVSVFDNVTKELMWCYNLYEIAGADGRSIGALHVIDRNVKHTAASALELLYVVFTIDGAQGAVQEDFRRFTQNGWISSYGRGGGPKVSVIAQINITTGAPTTGTYVKSQLRSSDTNSLVVSNISYETKCNPATSTTESLLRVQALAYYLPMSVDGVTTLSENDCLPDTASPFNYTITLSRELDDAFSADCRSINSPTVENQQCI